LTQGTVIKGKRYTPFEKAFMAGKKAAAFYFRGRERLYTDTIDAERDLHEAGTAPGCSCTAVVDQISATTHPMNVQPSNRLVATIAPALW
jgi:hypothetical protein